MTLALTPPAWVAEAACASVDPNLFTPEDKDAHAAYRHARLICATCPVQRQCLEMALENNERYGMWGGLTPSERQKLERPGRDPGVCVNGHEIAKVGRHASGICRQCRRDSQRRYEQRRRRRDTTVAKAARQIKRALPQESAVDVVTRRMDVMGVPA